MWQPPVRPFPTKARPVTPAPLSRHRYKTTPSSSHADSAVSSVLLLAVPSHGGSLLGGHPRGGLAGQGVHGPQELVGDAAGLAQPAQQRPVHRGRVVADGVFAREEQPRDGLGGHRMTAGFGRGFGIICSK